MGKNQARNDKPSPNVINNMPDRNTKNMKR